MSVDYIVPANPQGNFPIVHVNGNAAAFTHIADSPGPHNSYYITGFLLSGGSSGDGFRLIRRSSLKFSAANNTLTVTDNAALEPGANDFSLVFGVKTEDVSMSAVIAKTTANNKYDVSIDANGKLVVTIGDGTDTASITSYSKISDGKWHEVVVSCDRDSETGLNLYIDGAQAADAVDSTDVDSVTGAAANLVCTGTAGKIFYLSTLALYTSGFLTAAQAKTRWGTDSGLGGGCGSKFIGTETNLAFAINIDEGTGNCNDLVGSNDGTVANATWNDGEGLPIDAHTLKKGPLIACEGGSAKFGMLPHAVKIGRNNPIRIDETDGSFEVWLFGHLGAT